MGRGKNVTKEVSDNINELRNKGYSVKEVQTMLGVSRSSVVRYTKSNATKRGLSMQDKVIIAYLNKKSPSEIVYSTKYTRKFIDDTIRIFEDNKTKFYDNLCRGGNIISRDKYNGIIRRYLSGDTITSIANKLQLSSVTVDKYVRQYLSLFKQNKNTHKVEIPEKPKEVTMKKEVVIEKKTEEVKTSSRNITVIDLGEGQKIEVRGDADKFISIINKLRSGDPSIDTDTIIHLHLVGKNIDDIANEVRVDKETAENYIKVYESSKTLILPRRGNRVVTESVYDKMIRMYTGESTIDTIAKSLNISEPLVGRYIISYKTYMTGGNHKPAKRKNAKINLLELVELKQAGFTTSEMAAYFDVAEGSINERLLEAKRNGMFIDVKKAKTVKNNTTTTTSNSEKESSTELTQSQSQKPVTLETAEPSTLETTDSPTTSLEFTVIGDKAMEMVDKLMKFKDSTVTIKDIAELSSLIESATIRKYKLTKK